VNTNKKNFREDRSCESCGNSGAALVSDDIDAFPQFFCEICLKFRLNRKMTSEEIIILVEKHWGTEADGVVDICPHCGGDRIIVQSIDKERQFSRCACGTKEGFKVTRFFRLG
jgi:transcription elongation factor Elf1